MTCDWCITLEDGTVKCKAGNEKTCDYKTLPCEKEAIISRIKDEMGSVERSLDLIKATKEQEEMQKYMVTVKDKLLGIKYMMEVLQTKFNYTYKDERNPFRFAILVAKVTKHVKKYG